MSLDSIAFLFKRAVSNIFRNFLLSMASAGVLGICLVIIGTTFVIISNVNVMIDGIGSRNRVVVRLNEEMTEEQVVQFGENLEKISNIANITYETKEQALENYKNSFAEEDRASLTDGLEADIFRASYIFEVKDLKKFDQTIYEVGKLEGCDQLDQKRDVNEKIVDLRDVITFFAGFIIIFLFIMSFFMISNSVRTSVYARRDEIMIMKYVGSTDSFIRFPYFAEGFLIGCISGIMGYWVLKYLYVCIISPVLAVAAVDFSCSRCRSRQPEFRQSGKKISESLNLSDCLKRRDRYATPISGKKSRDAARCFWVVLFAVGFSGADFFGTFR